MGDLRREEAIDHLYERMELAVKRKVLKAARNYVLVSFSNVRASFFTLLLSPAYIGTGSISLT